MRIHGGPGEPWRRHRAHEERRHREGQLVHEATGEELAAQPRPALDQQPVHATAGQVGEDRPEPHRRRDGDDRRQLVQPVLKLGRLRRSAVDNRTGAAGAGEEPGSRIQVAAGGEGHPGRVLGKATAHPAGPAARGPDHQARVVAADRARADHDRVRLGPFGVDPVEVGVTGQDQPLRPRRIQAAIHGHCAAQQHIWPFGRLRWLGVHGSPVNQIAAIAPVRLSVSI
jgi:hypothetical protein